MILITVSTWHRILCKYIKVLSRCTKTGVSITPPCWHHCTPDLAGSVCMGCQAGCTSKTRNSPGQRMTQSGNGIFQTDMAVIYNVCYHGACVSPSTWMWNWRFSLVCRSLVTSHSLPEEREINQQNNRPGNIWLRMLKSFPKDPSLTLQSGTLTDVFPSWQPPLGWSILAASSTHHLLVDSFLLQASKTLSHRKGPELHPYCTHTLHKVRESWTDKRKQNFFQEKCVATDTFTR